MSDINIKNPLNSDVVCRLCLRWFSNVDNVGILNNGSSEGANSLRDKIYMLFNIKVPANGQLQFVCIKCNEKILDFYKFYHIVLKNNEIFLKNNEKLYDHHFSRASPMEECDTKSNSSCSVLGSPQKLKVVIQKVSDIIIEQVSTNRIEDNPALLKTEQETVLELSNNLNIKTSKATGDEQITEFIDLVCTVCTSTRNQFKTFKDLQVHYRTEHNTRGYIICCDKKLYRKDRITDHITNHVNPDAFKCPKCGQNSKSNALLKIHMKQHLPVEQWQFECDKCGQRFVLKSQLTNHKATHLSNEQKKFVCEECGKAFALKFALNKHKETHSKEKKMGCEICAKLFSCKANLVLHLQRHKNGKQPREKKFICEICAKSFSRKKNLVLHLQTHNCDKDQPRVQCSHCGQLYKNIQTLKTHMRQHADTRTHFCETCNKEFTSNSSLLAHIRYVHEKISQYECELCQKQFRRKIELTEHIARHTGEALYNCLYCSKTFFSSSNLFAHRKQKHPNEIHADKEKAVHIGEG